MRLLPSIKPICDSQVLIKRHHLVRQHNHQTALSRTLEECYALKEQTLLENEATRFAAEQAGFNYGFQIIFPMVEDFLRHFEEIQTQRMEMFRQSLINTLRSALHSPDIAQTIVNELLTELASDTPPLVVIPDGVLFNESSTQSIVIRSGDNSFSVGDGTNVLHFPIDSICQQWLTDAECEGHQWKDKIHLLNSDLVKQIINKLTLMVGNTILNPASVDTRDECN